MGFSLFFATIKLISEANVYYCFPMVLVVHLQCFKSSLSKVINKAISFCKLSSRAGWTQESNWHRRSTTSGCLNARKYLAKRITKPLEKQTICSLERFTSPMWTHSFAVSTQSRTPVPKSSLWPPASTGRGSSSSNRLPRGWCASLGLTPSSQPTATRP